MIDLSYKNVAPDWQLPLERFFHSVHGQKLLAFLQKRISEKATIFPATPFKALELTSLADTRVVIVGQDPYHGPGQAQGLAFHVAAGCKIPPSLKNIHKELARDLGIESPATGELTGWARQGVLLLNAVLTVEEGKPASHAKKDWETLTDELLRLAAADARPKVFLLWGNFAQSKKTLIESQGQGHLILEANHPSPLSARRPPVPFIGCSHFSRTNRWLSEHGQNPIHWEEFSEAGDCQKSFLF